ncbi:rod shape-determining protein MreC [Candidatus Termititenax spirochaetophilus]|uniref:Cell shape-determining protein MreC n=1 Tax=Candidatus Termititenax spirochaetophilus TaxID=2218522 RepID=A0A388T6E8_9BACT|nr:rod shape-determining protein MreC [Candidatus Termititenax spirochaetophilus]
MQRGHFPLLKILRVLIIVVLLGAAVKFGGGFILERLPASIADKFVYLQEFERNTELWFGDFAEAIHLVALKRERDRNYEVLYRQQNAETSLLYALTYENNRLRNAMRFQRGYSGRLIPAEVTGRGADNWFRFVTVNKGSKDGIKKNMIAIDAQGLVGYIHEEGKISAKVMLITDPLVNVSCINERNGEIYVLVGKDNDRLELKYATLHSDIREGDRLLTSGYSYQYKKGLLVGVVSNVSLPKNNLSKKVTVRPAANLSGLDVIFFVQ